MSYGLIKPPFGTPLNRVHPLAQGLVGCWLFNEGSGNRAWDASGCENRGTLINMSDPPTPTSGWGPGPHGGALALDGINDWINFNTPFLNPAMTYVIQHKYTEGFTESDIVFFNGNAASNGYGLFVTGGVYNLFCGGIAVYSYDVSPQTNIDTQLILVKNEGLFSLYRNSLFIKTLSKSYNTPTSFFYISDSLGRSAINIAKLVSSIQVYNRALSAEEVAWLYAFPYCMFEDEGYPAWMIPTGAPPGGNMLIHPGMNGGLNWPALNGGLNG